MSDAYLPGDTRQRIQDLIKGRKITQAELAEKVGLSNSALSRYLQGNTKNLGDGFIIRIAKYFDVSTDFLLGETDIPARKNYDIEELGLSAETAKLLYTGKVNASMLNQLIEHPRFPQLLLLLSRYRDETMIAGVNTMNQVLSFSRSLLLGQAKLHPEDAEAAGKGAQDMQMLSPPPVTADTNTIQNFFMQNFAGKVVCQSGTLSPLGSPVTKPEVSLDSSCRRHFPALQNNKKAFLILKYIV